MTACEKLWGSAGLFMSWFIFLSVCWKKLNSWSAKNKTRSPAAEHFPAIMWETCWHWVCISFGEDKFVVNKSYKLSLSLDPSGSTELDLIWCFQQLLGLLWRVLKSQRQFQQILQNPQHGAFLGLQLQQHERWVSGKSMDTVTCI